MRWKKEILEEASINLTPLIDVVFVILIMFIVVAPLLEIDQIELPPASQVTQSVQTQQNLAIHVYADDTISLNNQPVSLAQLEKFLVQVHMQHPNRHPQLFHDRQATFGTYQLIKNIVESAGFSKLDVFLKPQ